MPEILKVTTPVVNNNNTQQVNNKNGVDPLNPFSITDPTRVVRTHNQKSDILKQHTGKNEKNEGPVMLMSLLKDPAVAVSYLKNIFMLEEIFKLLPANNQTVTPEIEQMFQQLLVSSDNIQEELLKQESGATQFKGELFDFLRQVNADPETQYATRHAIATLLRSINNLSSKQDVLDAIANSLSFLKSNMQTNPTIFTKLDELMKRFREIENQSINKDDFTLLKEDTLNTLKDIENSLLFSPKLSKVISIMIYNLSRYNDNMLFFNESSFRLRQLLQGEQKRDFISLIGKFAMQIKTGEFPIKTEQSQQSKVMESLIKLVQNQSVNEEISNTESAKIDNILHSLLSSPCNFTPLLHFIIPVMHQDVKAFAEIWINPESEERSEVSNGEKGRHFLLVIDIETMGQFEAEVFSYGDNMIDFILHCPTGYETKFADMMDDIPKILKQLNYKVGKTGIETLDKGRSLMEVFKSLPYRRVGVDVKI